MKQTTAQFKAQVDSITFDDVKALRERKAKHALKLGLITWHQYFELFRKLRGT